MQAQACRQQVNTQQSAVTHAQSIQAVQTLITAGLGCITWLRDLLPSENFSKSYFTTSDDSFAYESCDDDKAKKKRSANSFQIMTMARGYTPEADKILDYLDHGLFDALQKQYLKSFVFGIFLDPNDPNNMVEAYTFNFSYHKIPGTDLTIPVMTIGDDIKKRGGRWDDPVAQAAKRGQVPTFKDVKRSVKTLLKALIQFATNMDDLPKHRHATFKIFYTDATPEDYEPPHFKQGDYEKDKWYFTTHHLDEIPEQFSVGSLKTGHHDVAINITSIASFLPSNSCQDDAPFSGLSSQPPTNASIDSASRFQQIEAQAQDAAARRVHWSMEESELTDDDAEGEDDPDYLKAVNDRGAEIIMVPVGIRAEDGTMKAIDVNEVHYRGRSEDVPTCLQAINATGDDTQSIAETQPLYDSEAQVAPTIEELATPRANISSLPPSSPMSQLTESTGDAAEELDTQMLKCLTLEGDDAVCHQQTVDSEMLDLETQAVDAIESSHPSPLGMGEDAIEVDDVNTLTPLKPRLRGSFKNTDSEGDICCDCGFSTDDDSLQCEGVCKKWFHLWCMGYHSAQDSRLPTKFTCLDCRLRADVSWDLIKTSLHPAMMNCQRDVASFRRAIKVSEVLSSITSPDFVARMGCDNTTARQLIKRLKDEGFIKDQNTYPETGRARGRGKGIKRGGRLPKQRYSFSFKIKATSTYRDYFNVDPMNDPKIKGDDIKPMFKSNLRSTAISSSSNAATTATSAPTNEATEVETQAITTSAWPISNKRPLTADSGQKPAERPRKKPKISVTLPVDLAE